LGVFSTDAVLGLVLPIKKPRKYSQFWQNFQASETSADFSNCAFINNSEEKSAKILQASITKKLVRKISDFQEKFVYI
jgi:hypothetical protein